METKPKSRMSCLYVFLGVLFVLWLISRVIAGGMIDTGKAGCAVLQSVAGQVGGQSEATPQTAEQCRALVDSTAWLTYGMAFFGTVVFSIVFCGFAFAAYLIFGGGMKTRREKSTPVTE